MKHFILFFSAVLLSLISLNAQDYQTVRSGRIAYFNNEYGSIQCIRIDSVAFQTDSVLYPMPNIQQLDYNCFNPRGNSWIGRKVILQKDGTNLFFNKDNDTIRIKTKAKINESWNAIELKDYMKVIAEIKSLETLTILGELDSVKTIGFQVFDSNGNPKSHYLNEHSLIISKNHGFVRTMNFNVFPEEPTTPSFQILDTYNLIGLTNPDRGVRNLSWLGVNDYQVGDEIHVQSKRWDWSSNPGYHYTWEKILKYLERQESKDSVYYRIERKELFRKITEKWDNVSYTFTHDTISEVYRPDSLFDKLPGEPIVSDYSADVNVMINEGTFIKKIRFYRPIRKSSNDSCWHELIWDGSGPGYFLKGLGGPYDEWNEINRGEGRTLVYYKKGSTTWGTPLVITDVKHLENADQLKIYPNPATDFVIIEKPFGNAEKYELSVIDMQGREVFRNSITFSNSYRLDLSFLEGGVYLLKLQNEEKQVSKMIVKKP